MRAGRYLPSVTAVLLALASSGCGGSTAATNLVGPDVSRCEMSVAGIPSTVPPSGTRVTGTVAATRECVWTASSTVAWITVSPASGQGEGRLTVAVAENRNRSPRSGAIVVNDRRVTLSQPGAPASEPPAPSPPNSPSPNPDAPAPGPDPSCAFGVDPTSRTFDPEGGEGTVVVETTAACNWTAFTTADWISIISETRGTGPYRVRYRVAANTSTSERAGAIAIGGRSHTIVQAGAASSPPSDDGGARVDLAGRVSNLSGSCPRLNFSAGGYVVATDAGTKFKAGNCEHLGNGTVVKVSGEIRGGRVLATDVRITDR